METLKGCGAGIQPAAAHPQEALSPQLSSSVCPLGQLLLLPGPSCTSQPLPLSVLANARLGRFSSHITNKDIPSVHILPGPLQKGEARSTAPLDPSSLPDLPSVPGASHRASHLV